MPADQFSRTVKDAAPPNLTDTRADRRAITPDRLAAANRATWARVSGCDPVRTDNKGRFVIKRRRKPINDPTADAVIGDYGVRSSRDEREILLRCEWCGANGSASPSVDTTTGLSWSGLPVDGHADDLRHRNCGGPVAAHDTNGPARRSPTEIRPAGNLSPDPGFPSLDAWRPTPAAEQLFDDMKTLGYFTDNTRLAEWGTLQSAFAGARQRYREAAQRSGPVEHKLGLVADTFEAALSNPTTARRIHELADEYRAADTDDDARRRILARRPLQPVEKAIRERHKEECNPHQRDGEKVTSATQPAALATVIDFPEVPEDMLGWLPSDERTVTTMLFDGHTVAEIAERLGYDPARVYRIKYRALRFLKNAA